MRFPYRLDGWCSGTENMSLNAQRGSLPEKPSKQAPAQRFGALRCISESGLAAALQRFTRPVHQ
jgi:hypothetical protein